jgi:hypothetical protein
MYDLTVRTRTGVLKPTRALTEDEVPSYVRDALACVGLPLPDSLTDPEFAARLVETGVYDESVDEAEIRVRRAA